MSRLLIHVEGETEETFVNEILRDHLYTFGYSTVGARLLGNARQRKSRGGIGSWKAAKKDIINHLNEDLGCVATTMVDYYGLPKSGDGAWVGRREAQNKPFSEKALTVENALIEDLSSEMKSNFDQKRFVPYVMMHEFEGLLFSSPKLFGEGIERKDLVPKFQEIRDQFSTPEEINDSYQTCPSRRVKNLFPQYEKRLMGTFAILEIGLNKIRAECPNFNRWVTHLEKIPDV